MKLFESNISEHSRWSDIEKKLTQIKITNITFVSFCDSFFNNRRETFDAWAGIVHNPIHYNILTVWNDKTPLYNLKAFINALSKCKVLFTMSKYDAPYFQKKIKEHGYDINVIPLYHPIPVMKYQFHYQEYLRNKEIVLIGNWLRKTYSIFKLKFDGKKSIIPFTERTKRELQYYLDFDNVELTNEEIDSVTKYNKLTQEEYELKFSNCIVFLDLYLTTVNNVLLECITSNTPILTNKHKEFVDILGENYPMFFEDPDEIPLLTSEENVLQTHEYLKNLDKSRFSMDNFIKSVENGIKDNL